MDFSYLVPLYDKLAYFAFFGNIKRCQTECLVANPPEKKILVIGGGTGWIIDHIFMKNQNQKVYYLESSAGMLRVANKNCPPDHRGRVQFILGDETSIPDMKFDAIITNFVLDCFESEHLSKIMDLLSSHLRPAGKWYFSDFRIDQHWARSIWQIPFTWTMIRFFRLTADLESRQLADFDPLFEERGYKPIWQKFYAGKFIQSVIYQKP